jgi:signal transduction histidine kinase
MEALHKPQAGAEEEDDAPQPAKDRPGEASSLRRGLFRSLSARVLLLTMAFILFGVALVFMPSIAGFRVNWLKNRLAMAEVATLAVQAAPGRRLSEELRHELIRSAGARVLAIRKGGARRLILRDEQPIMAEARYDLRDLSWWAAIRDAVVTLMHGGRRIITVVDRPPNIEAEFIELALDERPLFTAMVHHSLTILGYSLALAVVVAGLLYLAIHWLLIRPIRRLSASMARFATDPENPENVLVPTGRADELGEAERHLADMQRQIAGLLRQRARLAALGLAVSKIAHELRNLLSQAQMISDSLSMADDPVVKKYAPKLMASLDRAIQYCVGTLRYGRAQEQPPRRQTVRVRELVDEVFENMPEAREGRVELRNHVPAGLAADADPDQLSRILANLVRNACQAIAGMKGRATPGHVEVSAWREGAVVTIAVMDDGPGLPPKAREHLFEAFTGSARRGGTGLGLSIARELARAHGGDIMLAPHDGPGTVFHVVIPDRVIELDQTRRLRQKEGARQKGSG